MTAFRALLLATVLLVSGSQTGSAVAQEKSVPDGGGTMMEKPMAAPGAMDKSMTGTHEMAKPTMTKPTMTKPTMDKSMAAPSTGGDMNQAK